MERLQELVPYVKEALHGTTLVAKVLCFLHVTNTYICSFVKPVGPSMLPTLRDGNFILTETITTRLGKIGSGDLVLVRAPDNPRKVVLKRIKGVEGDAVSYLVDPNKSDERKTVTVPKGHIWIEGDNIYKSRDSRNFGPVPCALVHSRVFSVVWPPQDFRFLGNKSV